MRKNRSDYKETQKQYYLVNIERKRSLARNAYYVRTNQLDKLKIKYPETYNMFHGKDGTTC